MEIICIVPVKYNSTRVPGKNYRLMDNKPLYWYIFNTLSKINRINRIICNTDSDKIKNMIQTDFSNVEIYKRPKHLEGGDISTNLLLLDTIESLNLTDEKYIFIQTHVTNPLLSQFTIELCVDKYYNMLPKYDSLFTVKRLQTRLYNNTGEAINHNIKELIPTQDLDPIYEENSCLYMFNYQVLKNNNHRIGNNPYMFEMSDIESSDIDYESDFILTEQLIKLDRKRRNNKVIIITGSDGGIGQAICKKFKKKNWIVIGIDIKNNNSEYYDMFFNIDLTKNNDYKYYMDTIIENYGRIDLLVNNAAIQICKSWNDYNEDDWQNTFNCNLKSCYLLSESFRKWLKITKGSIVNICSVHCIATSNNIGLYAVSKSALQGLTKSMSLEYIKDDIKVNCILPGAIETNMLMEGIERQENPEEALEKLKKSCPYKDIGKPENIADTVMFLYKTEFIVGSSLVIDGGSSIKLSTE